MFGVSSEEGEFGATSSKGIEFGATSSKEGMFVTIFSKMGVSRFFSAKMGEFCISSVTGRASVSAVTAFIPPFVKGGLGGNGTKLSWQQRC